LSTKQRFLLRDALGKLPNMFDPAKRNSIIESLPEQIQGAVRYDAGAAAHALNILNACLEYPGGLLALHTVIQDLYGGTIGYRDLLNTLRALHRKAAGSSGPYYRGSMAYITCNRDAP